MIGDMTLIIVLGLLVLCMLVAWPWIKEELNISKSNPKSIYDVGGILYLSTGFIATIATLAALGIFGYDFYIYARIAVSTACIIGIFSLLRYSFSINLLLLSLIVTLILFNPIQWVTMDRESWILIDLAVAVTIPLLAYTYVKKHDKKEALLRHK